MGALCHGATMPSLVPSDGVPSPDISRTELMIMLALLMALNALAIDAMLPALAALGAGLGVADINATQFVITAFLFGIGAGSVVHGPLSDRYGRRPVILTALIVYIFAALGCAFVSDFETLIALRVVQGIASAASSVVTIAIIRDRMAGDQMARMTSTIFMIFMIVPVIAPSVGQLVLWFGGWREIFLLLGIMGAAMAGWIWRRLPETLDSANVVPLNLGGITSAWAQVVRHHHALLYTLGGALVVGAMYGFLSASAQLFTAVIGDAELFPVAFACVALTMASTNFLNSRIVVRFGARRVAHSAICLFMILGGVQLTLALWGSAPAPVILGTLALNLSMVGLIGANLSAIAMAPFGHIAGTASSFQNSMRTLGGTTLGGAIGQQFDGTAVPMALGFLLCGAAALLCLLIAEQGRLFTRPGTTPPPMGG
jgi:MFS transporter, DHA1 family, multidrug resistance protein